MERLSATLMGLGFIFGAVESVASVLYLKKIALPAVLTISSLRGMNNRGRKLI